jgi:hypothetical protein
VARRRGGSAASIGIDQAENRPHLRTVVYAPNVIGRAGTIVASMDFRRTMPRRPTRFEILIPQLMKEAEADDMAEPPLSGYQVSGKLDMENWPVTAFSVSFTSTELNANRRL